MIKVSKKQLVTLFVGVLMLICFVVGTDYKKQSIFAKGQVEEQKQVEQQEETTLVYGRIRNIPVEYDRQPYGITFVSTEEKEYVAKLSEDGTNYEVTVKPYQTYRVELTNLPGYQISNTTNEVQIFEEKELYFDLRIEKEEVS